MDSAEVGSLWTVYYFWCAVCDPLVGIGIDMLKARGIGATTLLVVFTPLWTYLMCHIWSPDIENPTATRAMLLAFGLLQAMQLMLASAVLGSVFPAGPSRQVRHKMQAFACILLMRSILSASPQARAGAEYVEYGCGCSQVASLARQMLGIIGLLVGMVGPPFLSSDWDDSDVMSGPFVYFVGSAVMAGRRVPAAMCRPSSCS